MRRDREIEIEIEIEKGQRDRDRDRDREWGGTESNDREREWGERVIITVGWLDWHGFGQVKQFLHSG